MSCLAVEDLAVQVRFLDPVAVDQQHLADPAAGEREGGAAAEAAHAEDDDASAFESSLALRRRRPGGDVAEVAELTVVAAVDCRRDQVVVSGVLDQAQLLELREQVADGFLAEALLQLVAARGSRRGLRAGARPSASGFSIWMSAPALGRSR